MEYSGKSAKRIKRAHKEREREEGKAEAGKHINNLESCASFHGRRRGSSGGSRQKSGRKTYTAYEPSRACM